MKKNRFLITALVILFCVSGAFHTLAAPSKKKEGIAAIVNDDVITLSDIRSRMILATAASKERPKNIQDQILSMLIDEHLQLQESKRLGITVTDEQIDNGFATVSQQNGMTAEDFKKALTAKGVPLSTLRDQIRAQVAWSYVVRRKLRPQVNISESDIDSVFDKIERTADRTTYHVAEIFLAVDDPAKETTVKKTAEKLMDKMLKGASFSSVARDFSQGAGSDRGGDLGWIEAEHLPPALAEGLTRIKPGQISQPLRSPTGWHILYLLDMRGGKPSAAVAPASAASGSGPVLIAHIKRVFIPVAEKEPPAVISAKLARAKKLKDEVKDCDILAKKSADFPDPATGDMGEIAVSSLPAPVAEIVRALPDHELSGPIKTDKGMALIMVCSRAEKVPAEIKRAASPDLPPMRTNDASREKIATELGMERLDMLQKRYLQDLRGAAFIEKRI